MRKPLLSVALAFLLSSCGGSSVSFHSSPPGAKIVFDGKEYTAPFDVSGVAMNTYKVTGTRTGYLPQEMSVKVETGTNSFAMVFLKEVERPAEFATNVPDDGIRIRALPEPEVYEFLPYSPKTGAIGKTIRTPKTDNPMYDLKLLRNASGIENACFLVKMTSEGQCAWADCQPGGDLVTPMSQCPTGSRPAWRLPALVNEATTITNSKVSGGLSTLSIDGTKVGAVKSDRIFQAQSLAGATVWSAVDDEGVQDVWLHENGKARNLWHGEYGMGALDYFQGKASIATLSGDFIFAMLATDKGYKLSAMDKTGKIIDDKAVFDFANQVSVRRFEGFYGIYLTSAKGIVRTHTFDGKSFIAMPETSNCDLTKTTGIWLAAGENYEVWINASLSVFLQKSGNKHKVVYAGPRN